PATGTAPPPRFIFFPAHGLNLRELAVWLSRTPGVRSVQRASDFVFAVLEARIGETRLREILDAPQIEYFEPDCDGPDFLTTSLEPPSTQASKRTSRRTATR